MTKTVFPAVFSSQFSGVSSSAEAPARRASRSLGVQLFGGTVYDGNPALEGTDYMEEGYDILNNNDYAMAFMSLFTFITAGPYHEFIEAAEAAIPVVGYLYHVSFYVRGQC